MAKKYPGLYLYFDWLKNLETMPKEVAMEIVLNLYHYAEEQREPEPLGDPHYEIVQNMLLDQLKRAVKKAESNRVSALRNVRMARELQDARDARYDRYDRSGLWSEPYRPTNTLTDEELLEQFRNDEQYKNDDPYELLRLQRLITGPYVGDKQSNELNTST